MAADLARLSVIFNADGQISLSGGFDRTIKLWDIATGRCIMTLMGDRFWSRLESFWRKTES
jgi:WD40 repeat protein